MNVMAMLMVLMVKRDFVVKLVVVHVDAVVDDDTASLL